MKNRWIPLMMLAVVLVAAPAAMAGHECYRCGWNPADCMQISVGEGRTYCEPGLGDEPCVIYGYVCFGGHAAVPPPISLDYEVVSVEPLDESQSAQPQLAAFEPLPAVVER